MRAKIRARAKVNAAEYRAQQLQRETSYQRAISWARLTSVWAAACCYFTVLLILAFSSRAPLPMRIDIGTDLAHSSSCCGLWLPGAILACVLCRRLIVYIVEILNEPNLIFRYGLGFYYGRNFWDDWDKRCFSKLLLTYVFYFFNMKYVCCM